jgi:hypothetical protein
MMDGFIKDKGASAKDVNLEWLRLIDQSKNFYSAGGSNYLCRPSLTTGYEG